MTLYVSIYANDLVAVSAVSANDVWAVGIANGQSLIESYHAL